MIWLMTQTWNDLLFAHWPVPAHELRPLVPRQLELDLYNGTTWVSVVAFHLTNNRLRGMPPVPGTTAYPALNLRTYVHAGGKHGVYFFSLDADHRGAVWGGRLFFNLPYYKANIQVTRTQSPDYELSRHGEPLMTFKSARQDARGALAAFQAAYHPLSSEFLAAEDPIASFLTERYYLYTVDQKDRLYRGEIRHEPWLVREAALDITVNSVADAAQITLPRATPLAYYSSGVKAYLSGMKLAETDLSESN